MAQLNPSQQAAVDHRQGPLLILAGAGSGKTRVITQRIAALMADGVQPEAILAVSFTNKAAEEMRERMVPLVGKKASERLFMSTFHSFGVRFLGEERDALGFGGRYVIFDQGDSLGVVRDILREMREAGAARKLDAAGVFARISNWKNALLAPEAVPESDFEYDDIARDVYPEYLERMRAMRALDFDDLVVRPVQILQEHSEVRQKWRDRFRFLMVDEFQDTSAVQLELCKQLTNQLGNICVVGDDDQSIYGWRGADVGNILEFDTHYPGTEIVKLEDNYRSRLAILEVANAAISRSLKRHGKILRSARGPGEKVKICPCEDPADEAVFVAKEIAELQEKGTRLDDIAILYRSNLQARSIEEELTSAGIAYRLFGGTQFFDRKEVKDAAAYLRLVINPRDEISLRRIINYPARGVGAKTVDRLARHAKVRGISLLRALDDVDQIVGIPDNAKRSVTQFKRGIDEARTEVEAGQTLSSVARALLEGVNIRGDLKLAAEGGKVGDIRWSNVEHLLSWLSRYEQEAHRGAKSLQGFLERVTLRGEDSKDDASEGVVLSTLHASKGLEFPVVFLIGCTEGYMPHARTTDPKSSEASPTSVDEERRLFYVGVTRAQDQLYIGVPGRRMVRGKPTKLVKSRFLDGLPDEHIEEYRRTDTAQLEFDEIAELGRDFLKKLQDSRKG